METPTQTPDAPGVPAGAVLDLEDLQAHYRIGRTKALDLVADPSFVKSVVPGMHRYPAAAVAARDMAVSLAGSPADPARAVPPPPVVVMPPAPARPGPRPRSGRKAA